jgi:hypothetical protein
MLNPVEQLICCGSVSPPGGGATDGLKSQTVSGCVCTYNAGNGGWDIVFPRPIVDPNRLLILLTYTGGNSGGNKPSFPLPANVGNNGFSVSFETADSLTPSHPETIAFNFRATYRVAD